MRKRLVSLLLTASLALGLWVPAMGAADTPALTADAPEMEKAEPAEDNAMSLFAAQTPEAQSFTVTLDAGEESVEPHTYAVTVTNGQAYGELPEPGRYAHAFLGWFTQQEGGTQITADTIVTLTANQTLYAHWKQVTFLIYLDPNGGSPTYWYVTAYEGEPYGNQIDKTPTRDGYDFLGWFTQQEGGELITADSIVHLNGDQSFYAHWAQSASFPVTLDANGGLFLDSEGAQERRSLTVTRETPAADLPVPYWYCYEFLGWFTEKEGGQQVSDDIMSSLSSSQTFYAHWTGQTFLVTLDPKGGTVSPNTVTVVFDHPYGSLPTPIRDGYAFDGWFTSELSKKQITPDTVVSLSTLPASETIVAHWTKLPPSPLVIAFESGGGSGSMEALTCRKNDSFTLPDCGFAAPAGMRFYGWKNGESVYSANFAFMSVKTDMTFTAVWKSTSFVLTLDACGGAVTPERVPGGADDGEISLPVPVRPGYAFDGWFYERYPDTYFTKTYSDTIFFLIMPQNVPGEMEIPLFAHWTELPPQPPENKTVFRDADGMEITSAAQVAPGSALTVIPEKPETKSAATVFCAVYNSKGAMACVFQWGADWSNSETSDLSHIVTIPDGVEIGGIRVFVLDDNFVPLTAPGALK